MGLSKKEKFEYWVKIIFLAIFGLAFASAAVYTLITYPFGILTIVYCVGTGAGAAFCIWAVISLIKEYIGWQNGTWPKK